MSKIEATAVALQEGSTEEVTRLAVGGNRPRPLTALHRPKADHSLFEATYDEFETAYDPHARILWQYMRPMGRPSYTQGLLRDVAHYQSRLAEALADVDEGPDYPLRYTVFGSGTPGVYNLGGDLPLFARLIRDQDRAGLRRYAYACVEPLQFRATNLDLPVISISLVQGDALGGGFECALADDVIIAERSAKFGFPEILFNLFPGMGAYSFLSRRIAPSQAERMMLSGRIYSADDLYEMGIVDVVAEDGAGEDAVYDYVERVDRSFEGTRAIYGARRIVNPVTLEEMKAVTDLWVETALKLDRSDLRKMERLAAAQDRRMKTQRERKAARA
ncbi:MAG: crotonase/enoyl-CoA hydratase family protein [Rhodospirillaceae bacterium]|jgi:DSF synthase|nr:crotonase/enoyl-CoA hydratase family protein [Rhodospirillaceae bacterium]MBT6118509.1 crotonase/enoyl-CoA hydratase family protein [Rhodospirillaceae bacterium]